jgi:hypothetical protein
MKSLLAPLSIIAFIILLALWWNYEERKEASRMRETTELRKEIQKERIKNNLQDAKRLQERIQKANEEAIKKRDDAIIRGQKNEWESNRLRHFP